MIVYVDTSALVKRYVIEAGSAQVNLLIEGADTVGTAVLARIGMALVLAKALRINWVETQNAESAWQEMLESPVTLATFDRELWLAAKKAGMAIWPAA